MQFEDCWSLKDSYYADKLKIPYVIVIGEDEIKTGTLTLRNMETGEQEKKNVEEIVSLMKYEW